MDHQIRRATTADIQMIRKLALFIWPRVYKQMISPAQMEYMLEWMYSPASLENQMNTGHHFLLLTSENAEPNGYASFRHSSQTTWKLEKLYVLPALHRRGFGQRLLERVIEEVRSQGGTALELQVNRNNPAVGFYLKAGFEVLRDEDFDIGDGFYMNDHIMGRML